VGEGPGVERCKEKRDEMREKGEQGWE